MHNLRLATPSDSADACAVLHRSISEVCALDYHDSDVIAEWLANKTVENVSLWIQSPDTYCVVCTDDDAITGFACASLSGEILLLYLVPEALHQGHGKQMLDALEARLVAEGITEANTVSSITARPFYLRNGYLPHGEPLLVGDIEGDFPLIKTLKI